MYNASHVAETMHEASHFGFEPVKPVFKWESLKLFRDTYIKRLNGIYESGLDKLNVTRINGTFSIKYDFTFYSLLLSLPHALQHIETTRICII